MIDLQRIKNQQEYTRLLKAMANTYKYTPAQQLAIFSAFPNATAVATLEQWNKYGRRIRRGSRGLPIEKDGKTTYLFDISQTYVYDSRRNNFPRWTYDHKCNDVFAQAVCNGQNVDYRSDYRFEENLDRVVNKLTYNDVDNADMAELIRSSTMFVALTRLDFDISDQIFDFSYVEELTDRELAGALTKVNNLTASIVGTAIDVQRNYDYYVSLISEQAASRVQENTSDNDTIYADEIAATIDAETAVIEESEAEEAIETDDDVPADEETIASVIAEPEPTEADETGLISELVTDDEFIENALTAYGTGFVHGKFRIQHIISTVKTSKERFDAYKKEFGIGGRVSDDYALASDSKGITITCGRERQDGYRKYVLNWSRIDSILRKLVTSDKYISVDEARQCIKRLEQDGSDVSRIEYKVAQDIIYSSVADELIKAKPNITVPSDISDRKKILEDLHDALIVLHHGKAQTGYFLWVDMYTALDGVMKSNEMIADTLADCKRIVELAMSDDISNLTSERFDEALAAIDFVISDNMLERADNAVNPDNSISDRISRSPVVYDVTNRNYAKVTEMFSDFMDKRTTYERYEVPNCDCYDPLTLEWISDSQIQIAHHYIQNGDVMYDPAICFVVDAENKKLIPFSYENHGLGIYEVIEETANQRERSADLSSFTSQWLKNIEAQGYERVKAIGRDGNVIEESITETNDEARAYVSDDIESRKQNTSEAVESIPKQDNDEGITEDYYNLDSIDAMYKSDGTLIMAHVDIKLDDYIRSRLKAVGMYMPKTGSKGTLELDTDGVEWFKFCYPSEHGNRWNSVNASEVLTAEERKTMLLAIAHKLPISSELIIKAGQPQEDVSEAVETVIEPDDMITLGGRKYTVASVDEEKQTVELRDDNIGFYPVTHTENISDVEAAIEQKKQADELAQRMSSPKRDFVITDNEIGIGTPRERYRRNIEAIKLLKQIESENRLATADEQQILAQYVGWGGLAEAFDESKWASEYAELRDLLTEEEYNDAGNSVLSAFYTQPVVIKSIYKALESFGFTGGNVLEPAMGTGNFFGCMPENIKDGSRIYGIEIDSISGRIAKQLYQNANIEVNGYENTTIPDNFVDVAIGNVPFGDFSVDDKRYNKHNLKIHDYFFVKTIDKVRAGGIIAFITSKGTLDKANSKVRNYISERCTLIGAVRLPNNAFKASAGTEAVSDIIFLQKREAITSKLDNWVGLSEYALSHSRRYKINSYFIDNPDMVCGRLDEQSSRFGYELTCKPYEYGTFENALDDCIAALRGKVQYRQSVAEVTTDNTEVPDTTDVYSIRLPATSDITDGGYTVIDGIVYRRDGSELVPQKYSNTEQEKQVIEILNIHASARDVIRSQYEGISDSALATKHEYLNRVYDEYCKKYGALTQSLEHIDLEDNVKAFCTALEETHEDENNVKSYTKAKIFSSRTIRQRQNVTHCDTVSDAFIVCMQNKARIDLDYISNLCDTPKDKVIEVLNGVQIFRVPHTDNYVTADEYLSGNVRKKLIDARTAAAVNSEYRVNVTALENVQPEWVYAEEISIQLGSSWIPTKYIKDFIRYSLLRTIDSYECDVQHHIETATWNITDKVIASRNIDGYETYGTSRMNALHILEHTLNMQNIAIFDKDIIDGEEKRVFNREETAKALAKQDIIKQMFLDWVWTSPARKKDLEEIYNNEINCDVVRQFDGSHLLFDGMTSDIELKDYQKNVVARAIYSGNTLIAHCVGAGKTYEMTAIAMEMRRVGVANKPLFVVPNHLIGQWSLDFLKLYPNANILAATTQDFKTENRKKFISRIATGDYDAIIMGHSTFGMLQVSKAKRIRFYEEEIQRCVDFISSTNDKKSLSFKQIVGLKKKYEKSLKSLELNNSEDIIEFEQLGVDALFIDEAHEFKNLATQTRLGRIGGISTSAAKRSEDLLLKIRHLSEINRGNKGVIFATGTPISNSLVELYTMQRYLQPDYLAQRGLQHFDSWAANYVNIETVIELDPTGQSFRQKKRCSSFNNVPELMAQFRRCADIQTPEMLNLPIPKLKNNAYTICVTEPSQEQQDYIYDCANRAEDVKSKLVDPHVDNMLKITNDGKLCAIDMRLVDPDAEDRPDSKINLAIENIIAKYHEFDEERLTQAVFLDKSTPTDTEWNLYDDIRNKLVAHGIPKDEIRFVHEAKNDEQKIKLFSDVNCGKVRIIIGSTSKMGAGTNMQQRLCALHHLDVPWRPSDIEQREGRILRHGNTCETVEIFRYVTRSTFDAYSWQTIENKQKMISQIMTDKIAGRSVDDVDEQALNYAEIKMLATGDTRIKEQLELSTAVARLKLQKGQHNKLVAEARKQLNVELPKKISYSTEQVGKLEEAIEYSLQFPKADNEDNFRITVNGKEYNKKREGGKALFECCNSVGLSKKVVGQYRGFEIALLNDQLAQTHVILSAKGVTIDNYLGASDLGIITRMDNLIDDKLKENLEKHKATLETARQEIDRCNDIINSPFQFEDEYREKLARLNELNRELALDERSNEASLMSDDDDNLDLTGNNKKAR